MSYSITMTGGVIARRAAGEVGGFGPGYLEGTVAEAGQPDTPVERWVHVYVEQGVRPGNLRREYLSYIGAVKSGTDGAWRFDELDPSRRYTIHSYDHTGTHDPVIKAGLIPTPYAPGAEPWQS